MTPKQGLRFYRILRGFEIRIGLPHKPAMWIIKRFIKWPNSVKIQVEKGYIDAVSKKG
jgi:hypothetical protein